LPLRELFFIDSRKLKYPLERADLELVMIWDYGADSSCRSLFTQDDVTAFLARDVEPEIPAQDADAYLA
jgi:hypothetical protein